MSDAILRKEKLQNIYKTATLTNKYVLRNKRSSGTKKPRYLLTFNFLAIIVIYCKPKKIIGFS